MSCKGLHCPGCGNGGGPAGAGAVIALLVIIAVALRSAWPAIVSAVEIAAWTVAGASGAALVITASALTVRAVRRRRARRALARPAWPYVLTAEEAPRPFTGTLPPTAGQIEPPRWPYAGPDLRPWIGGDGDERRPR